MIHANVENIGVHRADVRLSYVGSRFTFPVIFQFPQRLNIGVWLYLLTKFYAKQELKSIHNSTKIVD